MIIYRNTKGGFTQEVRNNLIAQRILNAFQEHGIMHNNRAEYQSWSNSMQHMCNALDDSYISDDCNVAIEYKLPLTGKRIDFLIEGKDERNQKNIVIIELKQWEYSDPTSRPDIVKTYTGGRVREVTHPSYQASSYAEILKGFNESVTEENINLIPCAYLHNYREDLRRNIDSTYYADAIQKAPLFLGTDCANLRNFIKQYIHKRSGKDLLMLIENGRLRPSKSLQDTLASMLRGNTEFRLIDEQKVAYETVKRKLKNILERGENKTTIIIKGGPGTGKSVVAIQLLCDLIRHNYTALYVTKNAAPRHVYFERLRQNNYGATYINSLFKGAGSFVNAPTNSIDCILADEAHRLMKTSGRFSPGSGPQALDIIKTAKVSVFFIDEEQKVTADDACTIETIRGYAIQQGCDIIEGDNYNLTSQFRCNGSDGYLALINTILNMQYLPNSVLDLDYDIQVFDSPIEMREALRRKNFINNKSRMVAGYCYDWDSKTDPHAVDIQLEGGFKAQWNFQNTTTWAIDANSFDQVGCIHTSQGLEFDYIGVIIGKDLIYRNNEVQTDATARARTDKSLSGTRKNIALQDEIIRNTYKTLLTRGQKGCYIYCEDKALAAFIREQIQLMRSQQTILLHEEEEQNQLILESVNEEDKYISFYPVYSIRAACGYFGHMEPTDHIGWMKVEGSGRRDRNKFIVQAIGHSMEPRINDGDYCLFQRYQGGSREGKIILAEHHSHADSEYEGSYSIKVYRSTKQYDEFGDWSHESIELRPLNHAYNPIVLSEDDIEEFCIVGEFVKVI